MPTAVDTQHPRIARAASIANTVEELQNLNRALAPNADGIAILSRVHDTVSIHELLEHAAKFALVGDPFGVAGGLAFGE